MKNVLSHFSTFLSPLLGPASCPTPQALGRYRVPRASLTLLTWDG